ncbi:MAG: DMT family transporter [Armatimonadota bacterium]|nr:DMT family transporter [Armatimonadota bacterium]MDR7486813.1 DMT family transporter [Armatimonadota bacterium]MDR7533848.1 DMT family transporter [Armatimonadota bacterium]MDR7535096.1 DMT family transporter [Armatimonadota bacterium]
MSGAAWALLAGAGFGIFQTINRIALRQMGVYLSTFLQLVVSTAVLASIAWLTTDVRRVGHAPPAALAYFAAGAFVHFFVGWTLLNAGQKRIGAARTSPLISTSPLFATAIAAVALRELPSLPALAGIAVTVAGVYVISVEQPAAAARATPAPADRTGVLYGLAASLCWAVSPVFVRHGLAGLPSPLLGLTLGLVPCVIAYAVGMLWRREEFDGARRSEALYYKVVAGALVGLSQWARWIALDLAPVGVVLALSQISVPLVLVLSPLVGNRHGESVTPRLWAGAALTVAGVLLLIVTQ